ncbi:MAG: retropepsin-like aspartic protease [Xenococcaceae cyanobacterium MO_188.B29]|nr:retropepsin-like aspartic protease [Xenococcaceae cyanobacterium MO_188.B29]
MSTKKIYRLQRQKDLLWLRAAIGRNQNITLLVRLLVDTGASYTVIPIPILQRLGCNLNKPLRTTMIVTANGAIEVPIIAVPWFNCLGIKKENFPVVGLDLPVSSFTNGLLGMDFLREVKAVIDVAKGEIKLENKSG